MHRAAILAVACSGVLITTAARADVAPPPSESAPCDKLRVGDGCKLSGGSQGVCVDSHCSYPPLDVGPRPKCQLLCQPSDGGGKGCTFANATTARQTGPGLVGAALAALGLRLVRRRRR